MEGLLIYTLGESLAFDPFDLTPQSRILEVLAFRLSGNGGENLTFSHPGDPLFYPQSSQIVPPPVPSTRERPTHTQRAKTPLFFPLSQLSQQSEQAIIQSGLDVEYMNWEELEGMLEGDGEEVKFDIAKYVERREEEGSESLDLSEDEFGPTQDREKDGEKVSCFCSFLLF